MVLGRTFPDVVKQNAYSHNTSVNKSGPLDEMQAVSRQRKLPGSVKEANISSGTVVPLSSLTAFVSAHTNNDRLSVSSNLNIPSWMVYLKQYWDQQLIDLLKFGLLLNFDRVSDLVCTKGNHPSAV